jgi:hypothetical protein
MRKLIDEPWVLFGIIGISLLLVGCSTHIRPQPKFVWSEMADSKIAGKLALYISPVAAQSVAKSSPADEFQHKDLMIGRATAELVRQACLSAFQKVVVFDKLPDSEKLKNSGFRGIFKVDSILTIINMPQSSNKGDSISYSDISIRLGIYCSADDFLIKQDIPSSFGPDGQYGKRISGDDIKRIDEVLKDLSERILKESGTNIAQSLVNIYGARP